MVLHLPTVAPNVKQDLENENQFKSSFSILKLNTHTAQIFILQNKK